MRGPCALMVAGTHSGCGKTLVTLGLMAALRRRGHTVLPFKSGPDFIDPSHHETVTGRLSHNLDTWMLSPVANRQIVAQAMADCDDPSPVLLVEGVMGLYDGASGVHDVGSSARLAKELGLGVVLVQDVRSQARSAAAVGLGFALFDPDLALQGVILNRVGSSRHTELVRQAYETTPHAPPVLGALPRDLSLSMESRHLGLVTAQDSGLTSQRIEALADWIEAHLDLDSLLHSLSEYRLEKGADAAVLDDCVQPPVHASEEPHIRIGVARDAAFCFYYHHNLKLLQQAGAELVYFSPLSDTRLPADLQGLYLGGGYPELHAATLSANTTMRASIAEHCTAGGPCYAECGGFMYLMRSVAVEEQSYPMAGVFDMECTMGARFRALGYRKIVTRDPSLLGPAGTMARGHEFHYSHISSPLPDEEHLYAVHDRNGPVDTPEGFVSCAGQTLGSYIHLHFGSNPEVAKNFVDQCRRAVRARSAP